jgi:glycosyltransferase involved in cell wall biosynthesis
VLLVGEGPEEGRLRTIAEDPSLRGRVTILPPVEDTAPFYRAADVYLSASHTEGMSVSVLEAMASANTVVASPASGMIDLLDGGAGVVAADATSEALAAALTSVVEDSGRRRAHGEVARRKVENAFSLEANAVAMIELYRSLIPDGRRR